MIEANADYAMVLISATACAAIPSPLPVKPIWSVVVALTPIAPGRMPREEESFSLI